MNEPEAARRWGDCIAARPATSAVRPSTPRAIVTRMSRGSVPRWVGRGPFSPEQLRSGDPYELSDGHAIQCLPTGGRGSRSQLTGAAVLESDPSVEEAGIDTGFAPDEHTLRAPDIAIGNVPDRPGWVQGAPPLAVEYADTGQDEADLERKIADLLRAGTRHVWVVRLAGPRHVEVHEPGAPVRVVACDGELTAPGILTNPVPVAALYDRGVARQATLRNLLQRLGYSGLEAVLEEGREQGREQGEAAGRAAAAAAAVLRVLDARGVAISEDQRARVRAERDPERLDRWLERAATLASAEAVLGE